MPLHIKNPEAERLARELARRRGTTITAAVVEALRNASARQEDAARPPGLAERLLVIGARYSALPDVDARSDEAILGWDDAPDRD